MPDFYSWWTWSSLRWVPASALWLTIAACGDSGGNGVAGNDGGGANVIQGNTVTVSPAQAQCDETLAAFDAIVTPSTNGNTVLDSADIVAAQAAFDNLGDRLLAL